MEKGKSVGDKQELNLIFHTNVKVTIQKRKTIIIVIEKFRSWKFRVQTCFLAKNCALSLYQFPQSKIFPFEEFFYPSNQLQIKNMKLAVKIVKKIANNQGFKQMPKYEDESGENT